jgi:hypothetical protein
MNDYAKLSALTRAFQAEVQALVLRENARHMMDTHLDFHTLSVVEEQLLPVLQDVVDALDWEPSDEDLLGEPAMSAGELHQAAHQQHVDFHN